MYRILIADDEDIIREGLANYIDWERTGFEIVGAYADGEEAYAAALEKKPDVVLTDVKMPFMDGLELSKKLMEAFPDIHILIISGHDEFSYAKEALKIGVNDYLLKPINSKELVKIMKALKEKLDDNENQKKIREKLNQQLLESLPLLKERFLVRITSGMFQDNAELNNRAKFLDVDFSEPPYTVSVIDVDDLQEDDGLQKIQQLCRISLGNALKNTYDPNMPHIIFNDKYEHVVCIHSRVDKDRLISVLEGLKQEFFGTMGKSVTVGIGSTVNDIHELKYSYKNAREALEYRLILGKNKIIDIEDIKPIESTKLINTADMKNKVIFSIKYNSNDEIKKTIEAFCTSLIGSVVPLQYIKIIFIELIASILRMMYDLGNDPVEVFGRDFDYYCIMESFNSIQDMGIWLECFALSVSRHINMQRNSKYSDIVINAKNYIWDNYQNNRLSLKVVANELFISHCYLSTIFKKETGDSFTEYISKIRIEKAREIIKTTDLKMHEIAEMTGFSDQFYFSQTFKKIVGISPTEYKDNVSKNPYRMMEG